MIKAFEKASGKTLAYKECPRRSGDLASVYADPTLAGKELGWTAQRDLDEMCKLDFILIRYYILCLL
jgi:UDP-glucose 4-epimerase